MTDECDTKCLINEAIFKLSQALVFFHAMHCIVLFRLKKVTSKRARFQNSWWIWKVLILAALFAASILIPRQFYTQYWIISLTGSILFMCLQSIVLIDAAHQAQKSLNKKCFKSKRAGLWKAVLFGITWLLYAMSIGGNVALYLYYMSGSQCAGNGKFDHEGTLTKSHFY